MSQGKTPITKRALDANVICKTLLRLVLAGVFSLYSVAPPYILSVAFADESFNGLSTLYQVAPGESVSGQLQSAGSYTGNLTYSSRDYLDYKAFDAVDFDNKVMTGGDVTLNADGSFTATAAEPTDEPIFFNYLVTDDAGGQSTGTASFYLNSDLATTNKAPQGASATLYVTKDVLYSGKLAGFDQDGDSVSFDMVMSPSQGTVSLDANTGFFTYTPNAGFTGADQWTYRVYDGASYSSTMTIDVIVDTAVRNAITHTITIQPIVICDDDGTSCVNPVYELWEEATNQILEQAGIGVEYLPFRSIHDSSKKVLEVKDSSEYNELETHEQRFWHDQVVNLIFTDTLYSSSVQSLSYPTSRTIMVTDEVVNTNLPHVIARELAKVVGRLSNTSTIDGKNLMDSIQYVTLSNVYPDGSGYGVLTASQIHDLFHGRTDNMPMRFVSSSDVDVDDTMQIDESKSLTGVNVTGAVEYRVMDYPEQGTLTWTEAGDGEFLSALNYVARTWENDSFSYLATNGSSQEIITVSITKATHTTTTAQQTFTTEMNQSVYGQVRASDDTQTHNMTYQITTDPVSGSVSVDSDAGVYVYTPNNNFVGNDSFVVTANNGVMDVHQVTVNLTITNTGTFTSPSMKMYHNAGVYDFINDLVLAENGTGVVQFYIDDADTVIDELDFIVESSNADIIPEGNVRVSQILDNFATFHITPVPGQSGTVVLNLSVTDGNNTTTNVVRVDVINEDQLMADANASFTETVDPMVVSSSLPLQQSFEVESGALSSSVTDGLVAYYDFNEASGDVIDQVGGNNGTLGGDATRVNSFFGNGALALDGNGDYVNMGPMPYSRSVSISAWVRTFDNRAQAYLVRGSNEARDVDVRYRAEVGGWQTSVYNESASRFEATHTPSHQNFVENGQWYHIVSVIEEDVAIRIYKNGVLINEQPFVGYINETAQSYMRIGGSSGNFLNGEVDELKIFNRALTSEEVQTIFNDVVNVKPEADDQTYTAVANMDLHMKLRGTDFNSDPLTYSIVTAPTKGSLVFTGTNLLTYTPDASFTGGTDTFTYKVNDGTLDSAPATVTINMPVQTTPSTCGNGVRDPGEVCDGSDLTGLSCTTVAAGYTGGTLACNDDCLGFDVTQCTPGNVLTSSCEYEELKATIENASDGDTIEVLPGTCEWVFPHQSNHTAIVVDKNLVIKAKEKGQTTIIDRIPFHPDTSLSIENRLVAGALFMFDTSNGKTFRFSGFNLFKTDDEGHEYLLHPVGSTPGWRIDNNYLASVSKGSGVYIVGPTYGLVDHNVFRGAIRMQNYGAFTNTTPTQFKEPFELGTRRSTHYEDNVYDPRVYMKDGFPTADENPNYGIVKVFGDAIDATAAGKYVLRYNDILGKGIEAHGPQGKRGTHSYEIYHNRMADVKTTGSNMYSNIFPRSGTGVIFNNQLNDIDGPYVKLYIDRACIFTGGDNACDGDHPEDGNALIDFDSDGDGVPDTSSGYPCADQHGRVTDAEWTGSGTPSNIWPVHPQELVPLYQWGNKHDNFADEYGYKFIDESDNGCTGVAKEKAKLLVLEDRDFFNVKQDFDGTSGVGKGLLAERPTCSLLNVGYWATDEQKLYRCDASGTWQHHYTPYPYPHHSTKIDNDFTYTGDPVALDKSVETPENTPLGIYLTAMGSGLTYTILSGPTNGTLSEHLDGDSYVIYTPDTSYYGNDEFTFKVSDGVTESTPATVSIWVQSSNVAPTLDPITANISDEDDGTAGFQIFEEASVTLSSSVTDPEGDALSWQWMYSLNGAADVVYLSGTDAISPATFTVPSASDGDVYQWKIQVTDGINTVEEQFDMTVVTELSLNTPPVATDDSISTGKNIAINVTLSATDADGHALTYEIVTPPSNGTLSGSGSTQLYTPNANYMGSDFFTFRVNDGFHSSNTATFTVNVIDSSVPQAGLIAHYGFDEDSGSIAVDSVAAANGTLIGDATRGAGIIGSKSLQLDGDGDVVSIAQQSTPRNMTVSLWVRLNEHGNNHQYVISGNPDWAGWVIYDNQYYGWYVGARNNSNSIKSMNWGGGAPEVGQWYHLVLTVEENGLMNLYVDSFLRKSIGFTGYLDDDQVKQMTFGGEDSGTSDFLNGNIDEVRIYDRILSNAEILQLYNAVSGGVNNAPVATADAVIANQNVATSIDVLANDTDVDEQSLIVTNLTQPTNGTVVLESDNTITYTSDVGFLGEDTFTYMASDGTDVSNVATVTVTVVDGTAAINFNNYMDTFDTYAVWGSSPSYGVEDGGATLRLTNRLWRKIDFPYQIRLNTVLEFEFMADAEESIHAIGFDDDLDWRDNLGSSNNRLFKLYGTEVDSSDLYIEDYDNYEDTAPGWKTYRINVGQYYQGNINHLVFIKEEFVAESNSIYFRNLRVYEDDSLDGNIPPKAHDKWIFTAHDTPVEITLTGVDAEDDPLTFTHVSSPSQGTLSDTTTTFTYTPSVGFTGRDTFQYKTNDGYDDSELATVTVEVEAPGPVCGNNISEPGEACDGSDINEMTCLTLVGGVTGGAVTCKADCSGYDVSMCILGGAVNAASCEQVDVKAAVDAAIDGDTVIIPAGTCTWTSGINVSGKNIIIQGAGIDVTTIDVGTNQAFGFYTPKAFRLTGMTIIGGPTTGWSGAVSVRDFPKSFRIDHVKMVDAPGQVFHVGMHDQNRNSNPSGLIDNITIQGVLSSRILVDADDTDSWARPLSFGEADGLYVESSTFDFDKVVTGRPLMDANFGARYVFRHNTVYNNEISNHGIDFGPHQESGTLSMEIYDNDLIIDATNDNMYAVLKSRGGTSVVYNNHIQANGSFPLSLTMLLQEYRQTSSTEGSCGSTTGCWGGSSGHDGLTYDGNYVMSAGVHDSDSSAAILVDSGRTWVKNEWIGYQLFNVTDGSHCEITSNTRDSLTCTLVNGVENDWDAGDVFEIRTGWLCYGAPGAGPDGPDSDTKQDLEPVYQWNNTCNGDIASGCVGDTDAAGHYINGKVRISSVGTSSACLTSVNPLKENRDYFNDKARPGYVPYIYPHPLIKAYEELGDVGDPTNTVPVANNQTITTDQNTDVQVLLTGSDADGDTLTFIKVSDPAHGVLSGTLPNVTYSPDEGFFGNDSFTFKVNDGTADSALATVTITVNEVMTNNAPVANNDTVTTAYNTSVDIDVLVNDTDDVAIDVASVQVVSAPSNGAALPNLDGTITYIPVNGYSGSDSFTYTVDDDEGATSNNATVNVTVNAAVNNAPIANNSNETVIKNTASTITVDASDADSDPLSFIIVTPPTHGTLTGDGPNFTYTPNTDYLGLDSFVYHVNDGAVDSNQATVSITVDGLTVTNGLIARYDFNEASGVALDGVGSNNAQLFGDATRSIGGLGNSVMNFDGIGDYLKAANQPKPDHLTVAVWAKVRSGIGERHQEILSGGREWNDWYIYNDKWQGWNFRLWTETSAPELRWGASGQLIEANRWYHLAMTFDRNTMKVYVDGTLRKEQALDGSALQAGVRELYFGATTDGIAHNLDGAIDDVLIYDRALSAEEIQSLYAASNVNEAPVADDYSVVVGKNTPKSINVDATDADGDALTYTIVSPPTHGTLTGDGPKYTYTPNTNYIGLDSFVYKVNDGKVDSNEATVSLSVEELTLTTGLIAKYDFNEESGVVLDSISGNNAELFGDVTRTVDGLDNSAMSFDGSGDYLVAANQPKPDNMTVAVWAKVRSGIGERHQEILSGGREGADWYIYNDKWQGWNFRLWTETSAPEIRWGASGELIQPDRWYHLAMTFDRDTMKVYVDGTLRKEQALDGSPMQSAVRPLYFGATGAGSAHNFDGAMDNVLIYDRALSEAEIQSLFDEGAFPPVAKDVTAYTNQGFHIEIRLEGEDREVDALTYTIVSEPANGVLSAHDDGDAYVLYTPNAGFVGSDTFTYRIDTAGGSSFPATVTIQVDALPATCGNGVIDKGEVCDGSALDGLSCTTVAAGFTGGILGCDASCLSFDTSACTSGDIVTTTCERDDFINAIAAAGDGDTIEVTPGPEGACVWTDPTPVVIRDKNVVIKAQERGQTVIVDQAPVSDNYVLQIINSEGQPFRLTGMVFMRGGPSIGRTHMILVQDANNFRVDHNKLILPNGKEAIRYNTAGAGLVDHNQFYGKSKQLIYEQRAGLEIQAFKKPFELGDPERVYFENNEFNTRTYLEGGVSTLKEGESLDRIYSWGDAIDAQHGGKYAARYNHFVGTSMEVHGPQGSRGAHSYEIYENSMQRAPDDEYPGIFLRGGTGVIFNNDLNDVSRTQLHIYIDRACLFTGDLGGYCDGTTSVDGNALIDYDSNGDGIPDMSSGYPCMDQHGRVTDSEGVAGSTYEAVHPQELVPLYQWNNRHDEFGGNPYGYNFQKTTINECTAKGWTEQAEKAELHLQENRDFYNHKEFFDGSEGVGSGLRADRPATCTHNVAYWATDDKMLYRCSEAGSWYAYYKPYPFPHPLSWIESTPGGGGDPTNTPPEAGNQLLEVAFNTPLTITLSATDADGDTLTYIKVSDPSNGNVGAITGNQIIYTPDTDFVGQDNFTFSAFDGTDYSTPATITIDVIGEPSSNTPPVANDDSATTEYNTSIDIDVLVNDTDDVAIDVASVQVVSAPSYGVALPNLDGTITYIPVNGYSGSDSFTYTVDDDEGATSNNATVNVTVNAFINNPPMANDQTVSVDEDTSLAIVLTGSDDDGEALSYTVVTNPSNGSLSGTAPIVTYAPNANYTGQDSFTFKVNDGTDDSNMATIAITVNEVNDVPVVNNQNVETDEGTSIAITLSGSDDDGDVLSYTVVTNPSNGSLSGVAPNLTYTPNATFSGSDSFTFKASDGMVDSNIATVDIAVIDVNDKPTAVDDNVSTAFNTPVTIDVLVNDIDDGSFDFSSLGVLNNASNGNTVVNVDGTITYTPNVGFSGVDTFTYRVKDDLGVFSNKALVTITVGSNNPPVADDQTINVNEDSAVDIILSGSDVEGDTLTYNVVDSPVNGSLIGALPNVRYTPTANFNGEDSFTFTVNDGASNSALATVTIIVNADNDIPVADNQTVNVAEDSVLDITLTGNDIDEDLLTYVVVDNPVSGVLTGTAPNVTYVPNADFSGDDSFTFKINDGTVDSNVATVSINVGAVNDAPIADDQNVNVDEDTAVSIVLSGSDGDGDALGYVVVSEPVYGTLSGAAPNVTYTPNPNYNGTDSFTFKVNDGVVDSNVATVSINVGAVNDAPIADDQNVNVDEDTAVSIVLNGSDGDDDTLSYVVVSEPVYGTLSGAAPNVTYTPNPNYNGTDSFTFKVNDGAVDSNVAMVDLIVNNVNDAPNANDQSIGANEDTAVSIVLTGTDVDGDDLTFAIVESPSNGWLSGTGSEVTYTPNANFNGTDSFTFRASDGSAFSDLATVSISVGATNDAPIANSQSKSLNEDASLLIQLTATDSDGDGLTYTIIEAPNNGSLSGTAPELTYTPNAHFHGSDEFKFKVNDGVVDSNMATVSLTVNSINDAPVLYPQTINLVEDTVVDITLSASDVDGDVLTYTLVGEPSNGSLTGIAPALTYKPKANFSGVDSFKAKVNDGFIDSSIVTFNINVSASDDRPTADDQNVSVQEDGTVNIILTGHDIEGAALEYVIVDSVTHGVLSGEAPNLVYAPNVNFHGLDQFTFYTNDGISDSSLATVSITVTAKNDVPVADAQRLNGNEDNPISVVLSASDLDGDSLSYTIVSNPMNGAITGTPPNLIYTPNAHYFGMDSFTFRVNDGFVDSAIAVVDLNINGVNDAPVAQDKSVSVQEDATVDFNLEGNDVDGDVLSYVLTSIPANGTLNGTAPALTYTPNADYNGPDSFTFVVNDGVLDSASATVTINVGAKNDVPIADNQSVTLDEDTTTAIALTGSDGENDPLTYLLVSSPVNGVLSGAPPAISYTPNAHFNGSDSFTFRVNDGMDDSALATVSLTINALNDAPTADAQSVSVDEDGVASITLTGMDFDGDALTYTLIDDVSEGVLTGTLPNLIYEPALNFSGNDSFTFKVSDGVIDSVAAIVNITVNEVNDVPNAESQNLTTDEERALNITLAASDSDTDDVLTYTIVDMPTNGVLVGVPPNLTYTPDLNFNGLDSFTFRVNDGTVDSNKGTIVIDVSAVNDSPIAEDQNVSVDEDGSVAIMLSGGDPDGDDITYILVDSPFNGTLSGTLPNLTYAPNANYSGSDSVTFRVSDGIEVSNLATVAINVNNVNDLPVANDQDVVTNEDEALSIVLSGSDPVEGSSLTYRIVDSPVNGVLTGTPPTITYMPSSQFNGSDRFTFVVNDGFDDSNVAAVDIVINPINDAPVAADQNVVVDEDGVLNVTLLGSDPDGDMITYDIVNSPSHGSISGAAPNITYVPDANFSGADSFTYRVSDAVSVSNLATVSIVVNEINDIPVADGKTLVTDEDIVVPITLTGRDPVEGSEVTFNITVNPSNGALSGTPPNVIYTPNADFNGQDSFAFIVNDGIDSSLEANVVIDINAVEDVPVADAQSVQVNEDSTKAITLSGSDGDGDSLTYTVIDLPSQGTLSGTAPALSYTPANNYYGTDSFTFLVNDGKTDSNIVTVDIVVNSINDIPLAEAQSVSVDEDESLDITLSGSDPIEGSVLTFAIVDRPSEGVVTIENNVATYTPNENFNGNDSFTFKVNDGSDDSAKVTVDIVVNPVNDAPFAEGFDLETMKNESIYFDFVISDPDDDALNVTIISPPIEGDVRPYGDQWEYVPKKGYEGADQFIYRVSDGAETADGVVGINVLPRNGGGGGFDIQSNSNSSAAGSEPTTGDDTSITIEVESSAVTTTTEETVNETDVEDNIESDNDVIDEVDETVDETAIEEDVEDIDGDPVVAVSMALTTLEDEALSFMPDISGDVSTGAISVENMNAPANGRVSGEYPQLTYTPNQDFNGVDVFSYRLKYKGSYTNEAFVYVTVEPVNDASPESSSQVVSTEKNVEVYILIPASDVDGDPISFELIDEPEHGQLQGSWPDLIYVPDSNFVGQDSFSYVLSDPLSSSQPYEVTINVIE